MSIRIIGIGEYTEGDIDVLRCDRYSSVSYETIYNVEDLELHDTDKLAIVLAYDHFDLAVEVASTFYQKGVLTLGLFSEIIMESGCFDAQTLYNGFGLNSIIDSITLPIIHPDLISFDINDIYSVLRDSRLFSTWYEYADNMDTLVRKCKDYLNRIDLSKIERACFNLYPTQPMDLKPDNMEKLKEVVDLIPVECQSILGISQITDMDYTDSGFSVIGLSLILSGKDMEMFV